MTLDMPFSVVLFLGVVILDILFGFGSPIGVGDEDCVEWGMVIVVLGFLSHFGGWCIVYVEGVLVCLCVDFLLI
jgi:hypothetical protein